MRAARWKYRTQKTRHLGIAQLCRVIFATKAHIDNRKKNFLSNNISPRCPNNMVNFGPLTGVTAEIDSGVWGTPANFNGFRVLATLLHGTPVVGVSQTLRRWTAGATIFGRAAITLGIGRHSSLNQFWPVDIQHHFRTQLPPVDWTWWQPPSWIFGKKSHLETFEIASKKAYKSVRPFAVMLWMLKYAIFQNPRWQRPPKAQVHISGMDRDIWITKFVERINNIILISRPCRMRVTCERNKVWRPQFWKKH